MNLGTVRQHHHSIHVIVARGKVFKKNLGMVSSEGLEPSAFGF